MGRRLCGWHALRSKHWRVPGSLMGVGNDLPHDVAQYVIEAATGFPHGFWGCVAAGATFRSTGRKRTKPGRAVIHEHVATLDESEQLAGRHLAAWKARETTPATAHLSAAMRQWQTLRPGEVLAFIWPSPVGTIETRPAEQPA